MDGMDPVSAAAFTGAGAASSLEPDGMILTRAKSAAYPARITPATVGRDTSEMYVREEKNTESHFPFV